MQLTAAGATCTLGPEHRGMWLPLDLRPVRTCATVGCNLMWQGPQSDQHTTYRI